MISEQLCVLIVSEDYAHIRNMLREAGYATAGVPDAESAREVFDTLRPAVLVIDDELARTARRSLPYYVRVLSKYPRTPVLGLVARDAPPVAREPVEDYDAICHRPLDPEELSAKLGALLGRLPPVS